MNLISVILIAGVLSLSGCSSIKKLDIFTMEVERQPLGLEKPEIRKLEKLKWIIITSENDDEVFKRTVKYKSELKNKIVQANKDLQSEKFNFSTEIISDEIRSLLN